MLEQALPLRQYFGVAPLLVAEDFVDAMERIEERVSGFSRSCMVICFYDDAALQFLHAKKPKAANLVLAPIYSRMTERHTTIDADELNCRVRNGNGCGLIAVGTRTKVARTLGKG